MRSGALLTAFLTLLGCELLGEILRSTLHLPVPGAVIGMFLLAAGLVLREPVESRVAPVPTALDRTAGMLIEHMGLLFVPAGVGIIAEIGLLRQEWTAIVVGVLGSTLLSLVVTGCVVHRFLRASAAETP